MKNFFERIFKLILIPSIFIVVLIIFWDPFKVFFTYEDYYTNNIITGNREDICYKLFNKNNKKFSNYIIGNSRSQAFKTNYWSSKISQKQNSCFHYDGSGLGLYRATNILKYLDKETSKIDNILLIVDIGFFEEIQNPKEHLFIQHPHVSNESTLLYYWTFIKSSIDFRFIIYNVIYKITGKHFDFMGHYITSSKNYNVSNNSTGDIYYAYDKDIQRDSAQYYNTLNSKGEFYKRAASLVISEPKILNIQYFMLTEIKNIINKNQCKIKIVVSPLYNQNKLNPLDKKILTDLFGENNVSDYSGINYLSENYTNFYESSHYKPYIANKIMDEIYK